LFRILIAVTALLIYGSLYPWHFHEGRNAAGPFHALLHSWQISWNRFELLDIAINIAIYIPFGAAAYLWLCARTAAVRIAGPLLLAASLSTAIEITQFYDGQRFTSLVDVVTNILGTAFGMILATTVAQRTKSAAAIRVAQPGALLLLGCWFGYFLFPVIPDFSRTHLTDKLASFFASGFHPVALFALFTSWLVAARLLSAVMRSWSADALFPLLGLLLPARFLVLGIHADWPYWASYFAAWFIWVAFLADGRYCDSLLGWMILASIAATGLSPFHFSAAAQWFDWIPFRALFSTSWDTGFPILLRKAFLYGSAIWLFHAAGTGVRSTAAGMALFLAAVEAAQLYMPNHAAEVTDPLLALLLAWMLHRLARAAPRAV
jgi:VanZ family protein